MDSTHGMSRDEKIVADTFENWQKNPVAYMEEALNIKEFFLGGLSKQQRDAMVSLGRFMKARWRKFEGKSLSNDQKGLVKKLGITIRAGQGPGKTLWAAMVMHWYLNCHYKAIMPCFAPKAEQLKATLFKSLSKLVEHGDKYGHPLIQGMLKVQTDKIHHVEVGPNKYDWAAFIKTSQNVKGSDAKGIAAQGDHGKYMCLITEESSAVELDPIFPVIEGTIQSDPLNFIIMIGNPNRDKGHFYDAHNKHKNNWITLHWSNEDCEFIAKEQIVRVEEAHGRDSNFFRVRVLGEFPLQDADAFFPQYAIDDMFDDYSESKWNIPCMIAIDPAGPGRDTTIVVVRRGNDYGPFYQFKGVDGSIIEDWVVGLCAEIDPMAIVIDSNGIGDGVYRHLRDRLVHINVYGISSHTASRKRDKYHRIRDELLWTMREEILRGAIKVNMYHVDIPDVKSKKMKDDFKEELGVLQDDTTYGKKALKVIGKPQIKAKIGRSPDFLDAFWMARYLDMDSLVYLSKSEEKYKKQIQLPEDDFEGGWLEL